MSENRQTDREQTDRESNYRGHSNPVDRKVERANSYSFKELVYEKYLGVVVCFHKMIHGNLEYHYNRSSGLYAPLPSCSSGELGALWALLGL